MRNYFGNAYQLNLTTEFLPSLGEAPSSCYTDTSGESPKKSPPLRERAEEEISLRFVSLADATAAFKVAESKSQ